MQYQVKPSTVGAFLFFALIATPGCYQSRSPDAFGDENVAPKKDVDIADPCADENGCDPINGICINTANGYRCSCKVGWESVPEEDRCRRVSGRISVGFGHACMIQRDSSIACWGSNQSGESTPPPGAFLQVSAGFYHTCGLRMEGTIDCWGFDEYGQSTPPSGHYLQISASGRRTCGIEADGAVVCWGYDQDDGFTPPSGAFMQISANNVDMFSSGYSAFVCGVRTNGDVSCWGDGFDVQPGTPEGAFSQVSSGFYHACGVRADETVTCWGGSGEVWSRYPPGIRRPAQ